MTKARVLVAVLVSFSVAWAQPKKLPDAARSLGKSMRIFKSEIKEMQADGKSESHPATPIASERVDAADPAATADPRSDKRSA